MAKLTNTGTANNAAFGQYGAVYAHDADTAVIPPNGMIFCAITMLGDTEFESLVSENPIKGLDFVQNHAGKVLTTASSSVSGVTVNTSADLTSDIAVGDLCYSHTGIFEGVVAVVGKAADGTTEDVSMFHLDRAPTDIGDAEKITFIKPNGLEGGGSSDLDDTVVFPKGLTIYGAWTAFELEDTDATTGVVAYLAPANGPQAT